MDGNVQRVEYLTACPSLYPIPSTPTAFVIDAQGPRFDIAKKGGGLRTVDALIKHKDNDSWTGNTGTGDSKVAVHFEVGKLTILCRRSSGGKHYVVLVSGAKVDDHLLDVKRRDLDPASRDAVFAAQRQTRRDDGTTAESHSHIVNGTAIISRIVNRPCHATRTIYVPVDASIRKALIIHPRNLGHNHPMPALKKPSLEAKESYRRCIRAVGCVGATVSKDKGPFSETRILAKTL
ncbi:hypothetical protein B0H16DRAFT_1767852 [Mycena metata]|uniref:Uncharacterized protein n=1 Tax=Mycena metata TaxID=1033252 RepID=A0AAD7I2W3_9AGAR|nr:hypothetical protein B0H16DRAFT_1767852 [Mycena metata]